MTTPDATALQQAVRVALSAMRHEFHALERRAKLYEQHGEQLVVERVSARHAYERRQELARAMTVLTTLLRPEAAT